MAYLLDNDICIFYLKGKFALGEKVNQVGEQHCFISEITLLELTYGAYNSDQLTKHLSEVSAVARLFDVLPIRPVRDIYGKERGRLRKLGQLIPNFGFLIRCTALCNDLTLVTRNTDHLERIEGLRLENWTLEEENEFIAVK